MKKILLLAMILVAGLTAGAREFTFKLGEEVIADGSKLVYNTYTGVPGEEDVIFAPEISLTSDIFTNTTKLTVKSLTGQQVQVCAGGNCVMGTDITKDLTMQPKQAVPLQLEYIDFVDAADKIPTVSVEVTVVDTKYPNTKKTFTITFNEKASVGNAVADGYSVSAVEGALEYSVLNPATLNVYTTAGVHVKTYVLTGQGRVSTASLPAGIYLYTLTADNAELQGKFIR